MAKTPASTPAATPASTTLATLYDRSQKLFTRIEKLLGAKLVTYWTSPTGSVCQNDVIALHEVLAHVGKVDRLYYFIKSDGGNGRASLRMVNLLRQHAKEVIALVPLNCESAATMLALGANEIQMGPLAFLSPVDTAITHDLSPIDRDNDRVSVSQNELARILRLWREDAGRTPSRNPYETIFQYVHPLVIGAVDRASSLSSRLCGEILSYHMKDRAKITKIAEVLNNDYPSHGYPIMIAEAQRIGLKAKPMDAELNRMLIELSEVYSEAGQRHRTDFDEKNHHDDEICNIHEVAGAHVHYRVDKDWRYISEERRWIAMNDKGAWSKLAGAPGKAKTSQLHIR
jgi:hypothetical protein